MLEPPQTGLLGLDYQELSRIAQKHGQPEYRARQLFDAIYPQRLAELDSVSTLPKQFRAGLRQEGLEILHPRIEQSFHSIDGTIRYLVAMPDGETAETVCMPQVSGGMHDFGAERVRTKLGIAVNAWNDEIRSSIMPINKKWNLEMLLQAVRDFPLRNRERITFEYVVLDGVNDNPAHAREVVELVRGIRCKVNLIALNPGPGIEFGTPAEQRVLEFQSVLAKAGVPAFIRRPRGRDIYAACGQLKRTVA